MRWLLTSLCLVVSWSALVLVGGLQGFGRAPLAPRDDPRAFAAAVDARIQEDCAGNVFLALLQGGVVWHEQACSVGEPVDRDSVFQVASLSKWIAAWGVMALVETGRIELDAPVERYLTRWHLPGGRYDTRAVTVRRLLAHTAGLTDALGYDGFAPGERIQTLEESLTRAADAMDHAPGAVVVGRAPGSAWQYSGGGYTLLQLVVEEVTGESFEGFMQATVLGPLGMPHSTFDWRRAERSSLATTYDVHGRPTPLRRFTALAAASLYTSASDLVRFVRAHLPGPHGEPVGRGVLEPATVLRMRSPQAAILGRDIWGLGTILYARNGHGGYVIGHDGQSPPAINTVARLDPATGDGIIVLASGSPTLATELASEWVLWQTGNVDVFMLRASADALAWMVVAGTIPIGLGALLLATRPRTGSDAPAGPSPGPDP